MPVGWERGVWEPLPVGAVPHVSRAMRRGDAETEERRLEAAMMAKACILMVDG